MTADRPKAWVCPLCRAVMTGFGEVGLCDPCLSRPDWEALPPAVRDEVGAMVDAERTIAAGYRLSELDGHQRPTMQYMTMAFYRSRVGRRSCSCAETDYGHASWACPSCGRPLQGCDHDRGEICAPCGSRPN